MVPQMNPVTKRGQLGVIQIWRKFPAASITMGSDIKIKIRALGNVRLENLFKKGKSPVPTKNPK